MRAVAFRLMQTLLRTGIVLCALMICAAGCTRPASHAPAGVATTPAGTSTAAAPQVIIDQVQVSPGQGIYVQGSSTLPNGECVQTELLADQQPVAWWPRDTCIQIDGGQWEILAALGKNGAPEMLNPSSHYAIQAWWAKQPAQTATRLPFTPNNP